VGVGPLLPEIGDDLRMSHAASGLLPTIPVLCMGLFALPAARLAARWGTRRAVAACLATIAAAGLARAAAPGAVVLVLCTIPVGIGMGLCGALLPVAVKERFAGRPALATGIYTTGIQIGAVGSALAVVALAAAGSWRLALAVLGASAALVTLAWLGLDRGRAAERPRAPAVAELRAVARAPVVWALIGTFALMTVVYYGLISWLPDAYVEKGWTEGSAAGLVALVSAAQIPGSLAVAWLGGGDRRRLLRAAAVAGAVAVAGLAAVPDGAWLWAGLAGLGIGTLFAVLLTLPLDLSSHATEAGAIAAVMLTGGYTSAALTPVVLGALRDATGSFSAALYGLAGAAAVLLAAAFLLPRGRPAAIIDSSPAAPLPG
jgi:CP family cyanate transporter-like MFS transporter